MSSTSKISANVEIWTQETQHGGEWLTMSTANQDAEHGGLYSVSMLASYWDANFMNKQTEVLLRHVICDQD